jgi:hypothetical protein
LQLKVMTSGLVCVPLFESILTVRPSASVVRPSIGRVALRVEKRQRHAAIFAARNIAPPGGRGRAQDRASIAPGFTRRPADSHWARDATQTAPGRCVSISIALNAE